MSLFIQIRALINNISCCRHIDGLGFTSLVNAASSLSSELRSNVVNEFVSAKSINDDKNFTDKYL